MAFFNFSVSLYGNSHVDEFATLACESLFLIILLKKSTCSCDFSLRFIFLLSQLVMLSLLLSLLLLQPLPLPLATGDSNCCHCHYISSTKHLYVLRQSPRISKANLEGSLCIFVLKICFQWIYK